MLSLYLSVIQNPFIFPRKSSLISSVSSKNEPNSDSAKKLKRNSYDIDNIDNNFD